MRSKLDNFFIVFKIIAFSLFLHMSVTYPTPGFQLKYISIPLCIVAIFWYLSIFMSKQKAIETKPSQAAINECKEAIELLNNNGISTYYHVQDYGINNDAIHKAINLLKNQGCIMVYKNGDIVGKLISVPTNDELAKNRRGNLKVV